MATWGRLKCLLVYVRYSKGSAPDAIHDVELYNVKLLLDFLGKLL